MLASVVNRRGFGPTKSLTAAKVDVDEQTRNQVYVFEKIGRLERTRTSIPLVPNQIPDLIDIRRISLIPSDYFLICCGLLLSPVAFH
jgi:hypothetical protein